MRLDQLTVSSTTPVDTDILPTVENVSTTHNHKSKTWATIMSAIGSYTQTLTNKVYSSPLFKGTHDGWIATPYQWLYYSGSVVATTTSAYSIGDKVRWKDDSTSYKCGYVANILDANFMYIIGNSFAGGAITNTYFSKDATPVAFPAFFYYTPTITAASGTFTTVSSIGHYVFVGRNVFVRITITITTNGTAAGVVNLTLPIAPTTNIVIQGREITSTGYLLQGVSFASENMGCVTYSNGYPGGDGRTMYLSGNYTI
jgi:hypothetical protein